MMEVFESLNQTTSRPGNDHATRPRGGEMEGGKLRRRVLQQQKMIEQLKSKVCWGGRREGWRGEGAWMYVEITPATILPFCIKPPLPPFLPPSLPPCIRQIESLKMALARHGNDEKQDCARCVTWEEKTKQVMVEGRRQVQEMKSR